MKPVDYRSQYAAFCSAQERARYRLHAGLSYDARFESARERASELWRKSSVDDLAQTLDETSAQFTEERAGLRALLGVAQAGYVEAKAGEITDELARCEAAAHLEWDGQRIAAVEAFASLDTEADTTRRRELGARFLDAMSACDDLRAARFEVLGEAARALGFDDYPALREALTATSYEPLASRAEGFLRRTEAAYHSQLSRWTAHNLPTLAGDVAHYTDALFFRRMASADAFFLRGRLLNSYETLTSALGVRIDSQRRIRIDDEPRLSKKTRPACFGVEVPEEIYLVRHPQSAGARASRDFFERAGEAQLLAWSSKDLANLRPEFIHAPDRATRMGYGLLFVRLFCDGAWLGEHFRLNENEAREAKRIFALAELADVRLDCARLRYLLLARAATEIRSESVAEAYSALYTEATGFRYPAALSLHDMDEAMSAAERLRARLFAAGLDEYLRGRYGHHWWSVRRAGDELVDLWNTSSRYTVEELAQLVGTGELDFEFLADQFIEALRGD